MLKDLASKLKANIAYTSGTAVDTVGFMSGVVTLLTKATTALTFTESDDNSTYTAVAVEDINKADAVAGALVANVITYTAAGTALVGYQGRKRYFKVTVADPSADTTIVIILGDPLYAPAS